MKRSTGIKSLPEELRREDIKWLREKRNAEVRRLNATRKARRLYRPFDSEEPIPLFSSHQTLSMAERKLLHYESDLEQLRTKLIINKLSRKSRTKTTVENEARKEMNNLKYQLDNVVAEAAEIGEESGWWSWSSWLSSEMCCRHMLAAVLELQSLLPRTRSPKDLSLYPGLSSNLCIPQALPSVESTRSLFEIEKAGGAGEGDANSHGNSRRQSVLDYGPDPQPQVPTSSTQGGGIRQRKGNKFLIGPSSNWEIYHVNVESSDPNMIDEDDERSEENPSDNSKVEIFQRLHTQDEQRPQIRLYQHRATGDIQVRMPSNELYFMILCELIIEIRLSLTKYTNYLPRLESLSTYFAVKKIIYRMILQIVRNRVCLQAMEEMPRQSWLVKAD